MKIRSTHFEWFWMCMVTMPLSEHSQCTDDTHQCEKNHTFPLNFDFHFLTLIFI